MTGGPVVRRLGARDVVAMHAMLTLFGEVFDERETYCAARPDEAYLQRLLDDSGFFALVAECDGEVIGALAAYELRKFEQARSEVYIYDLAVAEAHRRRGVATALIRALQRFARAQGAWVVFVQADRGDDAAIALYSGLGVREEVLHFDLPLDDERGAGGFVGDG